MPNWSGSFLKTGEAAAYLETERAYRSEEDVFEAYTQEERDRLFGIPPATVWETLANLERYPEKTAVLTAEKYLPFRSSSLIPWPCSTNG